MQWTKAQSDAINVTRRDVLVAAAAGSGKTATLTERVLLSVCRDDDPVDISRLLIVTFTEKAAAELKMRIRKKLQEKAAAEPENSRVRRQLSLLPSASVSTIHSFYVKILREGFSGLGLPPRLRIADEGSVEMIRRRVLNDVIDGYYNGNKNDGCDIENAEDFFDTFERTRPDEKLYDALCGLYDTVASYPEFLDFYRICAEKYKEYAKDFGKSDHFKYFISSEKKRFRVILNGYDRLENDYADDFEFQDKYLPAAIYAGDLIKQTLKLLDTNDYDLLFSFFANKPEFPRVKPVKGEPGFKELQNDLKKALIKEFESAKKILSFSPDDVKKICLKTSYLCECVFKVLSRFEKEFSAEKLSSGMVDFNDMERFAHRLLCGPDKSFAEKIAARYDEIYVDEYQDVNGIQDEIFSAISKNNRFMVGDVKQSIYSFRGADPTLFSSYRQTFLPYDPDKNDPSVIFLSENFRCGKHVIDFTNEVFRTVFGADERIPYSKEDELVYGKNTGENIPVRLAFFEGGKIRDEAEYAAKEIRKLLKEGANDDGSPLKPSDIAVLCQKGSACAEVEEVFSEYGLSCVNTSDKTFFNSPEVLLTVSILSAIDNPISDVQLAAAMKSPVFGFSLDELAEIRLHSQNEPLYAALRSYAEETGDEKCTDFIKTLSYLRYRSRSMPTDKFIRLLYKKTRLLSVIYNEYDKKDPADRRANLILLYELARKYESDSFKGLYGFISYCREMTEKGKSFKTASDSAGKITVQTVHGSKGLEYPVCFLIGAGGRFNTDYNKKSVTADRRLGLGIRIKTDNDEIVTGPLYKIGVMKKADDQITDQACLLYVAMTRAKKYLYITASGAKPPVFSGGASCAGASSFLDLLRFSLDGHGGSYEYKCVCPQDGASPAAQTDAAANVPDESFDGDAEFEALKQIYNYKYPYKEAAELPKKAAVSKLYPQYLDADEETVDLFEENTGTELILPDYADTEKAASAAQKGTSTHLFMQFCDFDRAEADVFAEARRLVDLGFIREEDKDLISYNEVKKFFDSDLYGRMKDARDKGRLFCREYRFNIELDAAEFTEDEQRKKALSEEKLLVQGVIDCFFEEEDGKITVADYKTDRVAGSAAAIEEFRQRHARQLSYYKTAVERIALMPVKKCELYSFCLGISVST